MQAARWWGRGDIRVEEVDDPGEPPEGWVRVRVEACGICGTDIEEYCSGPIVLPIVPHPLSGRSVPLVMGHEISGTVELRGPGVNLEEGTAVVLEANMSCGTCWWCQRGEYQLCSHLASLGLMADGGLAEYVLAPASMCAAFSRSVPFDVAALAEPLAVAVRAVRRGDVAPGATVGVIGTGPVGLLVAHVAHKAGAASVLCVERHASRRALALEVGADFACLPEEAASAVAELTKGRGLDVTVEAAGNPQAVRAAVQLARRGGRTVLLSVFQGSVEVDEMDLVMGEKEVVPSLSHVYDPDFTTAVSLLEAGAGQLARIVTDRVRLTDVVQRGFEALLVHPSDHLKVVALPHLSRQDGQLGQEEASTC